MTLGHDNSRLILPLCGITWLDLWSIKGKAMSTRHAAKLLGVDYETLRRGLDRHYLQGYISTDNGDFVGVGVTFRICKKCGSTELHKVSFSY